MYISEDIIREIQDKNDIVDVISGYIKLEKRGSSYLGLCPFHNEKTPSFSVSPNKQMFFCFGCHEGGDVISFIEKYENMNFIDALEVLGRRVGIELPKREMTTEEKHFVSRKNIIYDINKKAALFFHHLLGSEEGANAREYFEKRQLRNETVVSFGLGVSSMRSDALYRYMKSQNYKDDILKETGLFIYNERGVIDRFINRVMFPIIDEYGKVIGFGGRVMGDGQPKYLNSPETSVFEKGKNLFGFNIARKTRQNYLILCEGYMDVISMHQAGFTQAVASLGTALTDAQAKAIKKKKFDNVLLCYDSDNPGIKAAIRAISIFREVGIRTKIISMEPYKDADEFIKAEGADAFAKRIKNAENSFMFEVRILQRNYDIQDPDEKTAFFKEIATKLIYYEEEMERNNYIEAVCRSYNISEKVLAGLVGKLALKKVTITNNKPLSSEVRAAKARDAGDTGLKKAQRMLLTMITDDPSIYGAIAPYVKAEDFTEPIYRTVAGIIFEQIAAGDFDPAGILLKFTEEDDKREVARVLNSNELDESCSHEQKQKAVNDAVLNLLKCNNEDKKSKTTDVNEFQELMAEGIKLQRLHITLN